MGATRAGHATEPISPVWEDRNADSAAERKVEAGETKRFCSLFGTRVLVGSTPRQEGAKIKLLGVACHGSQETVKDGGDERPLFGGAPGSL